MNSRLAAAVAKEFRQFLRDRMLIALVIWLYTAEVVVCTYALSFDVRNLRLAVYDQDRTQLSQRIIERFTATEYFGALTSFNAAAEVDRALDAGRVDLALVIPAGLARSVSGGRGGALQLVLSGSNSNTANVARGYAASIVGRLEHELARERLAAAGATARLPQVELRTRIWYNPELDFRYFMAISMIVAAALVVGVVASAASMVREKETGTAEQLMLTPLRRGEVVAAKMLPPFAVGMLSLGPSLGVLAWFDVPFRGSVMLFILASALALAACLAIGILISTFARTLQQALLIGFFVLFPMMFLSGTVVPIDTMASGLQALSLASPVRHYMEIALGIVLKGVGFGVLWRHFAALAGIGAALMLLALPRLRRHLYA
jgi:ABC-2 type transport system permease protein